MQTCVAVVEIGEGSDSGGLRRGGGVDDPAYSVPQANLQHAADLISKVRDRGVDGTQASREHLRLRSVHFGEERLGDRVEGVRQSQALERRERPVEGILGRWRRSAAGFRPGKTLQHADELVPEIMGVDEASSGVEPGRHAPSLAPQAATTERNQRKAPCWCLHERAINREAGDRVLAVLVRCPPHLTAWGSLWPRVMNS